MAPNPRMRTKLPTKSGAVVLGLIVLYGLFQPTLNSQLGWKLPSLTSFTGQSQAPTGTNSSDRMPPPRVEPASSSTSGNAASETDSSSGPLYNFLRETRPGSETYVSPAGLLYTKGSAEGHRLRHLERHLEDQPTRPGKHGVFYGDMPQVLRWLDEAYEQGKLGGSGTQKRKEQERTVYEVSFGKPIGYVGGREGRQAGNPDCNNIRLVLESERVITAFPF